MQFNTSQIVFYNLGGEQLIPVIYLEQNKECSFICKNNNGHWEIVNIPNDRLYASPDEFLNSLANQVYKEDNIINLEAWKKKNGR